MVKTTGNLTGQFHVSYLVCTYRYITGAVDQDVCALQQRITEETVGFQILVLEFFLLVLVGGHAFQPAQRCHHRQQQMQFSMFRYTGLYKYSGLGWIHTRCQPVDHHVGNKFFQRQWRSIVRGQRMPVSNKEETFVIVLELYPVLEYAV